jgi:hypothetical protein
MLKSPSTDNSCVCMSFIGFKILDEGHKVVRFIRPIGARIGGLKVPIQKIKHFGKLKDF